MKKLPETCHVCGDTVFVLNPVLWEELIKSWQLTSKETDYINS